MRTLLSPARSLVLASFLSLLSLTAGCGGGTPTQAGRNLYVGGPVPAVSANLVYGIWEGAAIPGVMLGQTPGYFITANSGGSFRIVWTGDVANSGGVRHFTGSVWTQGTFTSQTPGCANNSCALEPDDAVSSIHNTQGGQRVDFDTIATDGLDGFDFSVDTVPALFNLYIDGQARPDLVYFASSATHQIANSAGMPFGLVSQP